MTNAVLIGESAQPSVIYGYTADDERLFTFDVSTGATHWTVRGFDNKVLRDFKQVGATWSVERDYVYRDGLLLAAMKPGGVEHYSLDHLGTVRLVTDGIGNKIGYHVYWPFGEEWSVGSPQDGSPLRFTGHERDADPTGGSTPLDYMHARYYGAAWGRFLSLDPALDLKKTMPNPQTWNRYTYVINNPLRYTDPDGREGVQEPGFTKRLSEANWSDAPPVIKGAFYAEGALLGGGAAGEAIGATGPALEYAALVFAVRFPTLYNLAQSYLEGETGTPSLSGSRAAGSAIGKAERTAGQMGMGRDELVQMVTKNGGKFIDQSKGTVNIFMRLPDGRAGFVRVTVDATGKIVSVGLNSTGNVKNGIVKGRFLPY